MAIAEEIVVRKVRRGYKCQEVKISLIQWTSDGQAAALENMSIDHGGAHIFVAEEFLYGADVVAGLQEVGSEGMPPSRPLAGYDRRCAFRFPSDAPPPGRLFVMRQGGCVASAHRRCAGRLRAGKQGRGTASPVRGQRWIFFSCGLFLLFHLER